MAFPPTWSGSAPLAGARPARARIARLLLLACGILAVGAARAAALPRFPAAAVWNQDISTAPLHPQSTAMLQQLAALGGWGNQNRFQIDFSIHVVQAAAGAPTLPLAANPEEFYGSDCEPVGSLVPVPPGGAIEGSSDYTCDNRCEPDDECFDCHLLVAQGNVLYELYRANVTAGAVEATCLARWNLSHVYPPQGRGEHCTSADAAGFPIAALLFNADEVAAGEIRHAIRFILPNARMASDASLGGVAGRLYVRPASHAGGPSGPAGTVPYGARLRLKAGFDTSGFSPGARVVLAAMKKYGIVLADGGNIALTAQDDRYTTAKWSDANVGITPQSLLGVQVTDFEVIDTGPRIGETYDCERTDIPFDVLLSDGFE